MRLAITAFALCLTATAAFAQPAPGTPPVRVPPPQRGGVMPHTGAVAYKTEAEAKSSCGSDPVVWGNTSSHVLHAAGSPYYGKTKRGGYMCQAAATSAGYHMSRNGN